MLNQSAFNGIFAKITALIIFSLALTACGGGGSKSVNQPPASARFSHVKMHYGLLHNQAMIFGEVGSLPPYNSITLNLPVIHSSPKGSTTLHVSNTSELLVKQLITYLGDDGIYYVGQIKVIHNIEEIGLYEPLKATVSIGNNAWDFYGNGSHANEFGFKAIADFSIKSLGFGSSTTGNHVLFGDSWFDESSIHNRLIQKLPNATIINQGEGGNTTRDLLRRFDSYVTSNNPDYVWIISGTNDYWKGVPTAEFKSNLNRLIIKSKAIGAKVIIIDSSVGEGTGPLGSNQQQSEEYANAVLELY